MILVLYFELYVTVVKEIKIHGRYRKNGENYFFGNTWQWESKMKIKMKIFFPI